MLRRYKMQHLSVFVAIFTVFSLTALQAAKPPLAHAATATTITVYPAQQYQTIQGWGTSLAWWANIIGGWNDSQRLSVADALYDPVKGIGLNVARYNFGADGPGNVCHNQILEGRNVPTFEPVRGTYDWSKDANQLWFAYAAQQRGANLFEGFVNSPPAWMLNNSCTSGGDGGGENFNSAYTADYASYMATIAQHFHDSFGIPLQTVAPFNEPANGWSFTGSQEGMNVHPDSQNTIIKAVGAALASSGVSAYTDLSSPDDVAMSSSINDYNSYDATAKAYLSQWNTHAYGQSDSDRINAYNAIGQTDNKRLWMSEWGSGDQGTQMNAAITLSSEILNDEQKLHPAAWVSWQGVNEQGGTADTNQDVWGLAYRDLNNNISYPSRYYAMGNYSKFIRPGYKMIGNSDGNTLTAYDSGSHTLVLVTTNSATSSVSTTYNLTNFSSVGGTATPYRTTASANLTTLANLSVTNASFSTTLPARSITTYVIPNVTYNGSGAVTNIDDTVTGSGLNQFNYVGDWGHCTNSCGGDTTGLYNGSNSWSISAGATASVNFAGSRIRLFGVKDNNEGIGMVSIDGGTAHEVDFYATRRAGDQLVWESPLLSSGTHTLTLTVTGRKNPLSSNVLPALDRVEIDPQTTTNLLSNAGFETGSLSPWVGELNSSLAGVEINYPHSGTYDAYLHPTGSANVALSQTIIAPETRTYTLTAYAANSTGDVQLGVDLNGGQTRNVSITANAGYQFYSTTFSATAGQTIKIWYYANAINGWATLDDVSLT